jgi:hypothetical protein
MTFQSRIGRFAAAAAVTAIASLDLVGATTATASAAPQGGSQYVGTFSNCSSLAAQYNSQSGGNPTYYCSGSDLYEVFE